jgi:hypothetical protein
MSQQRLKRLQRLESRKPTAAPWVDPFDLCMRLWSEVQAVVAGRAWLDTAARARAIRGRATGI